MDTAMAQQMVTGLNGRGAQVLLFYFVPVQTENASPL